MVLASCENPLPPLPPRPTRSDWIHSYLPITMNYLHAVHAFAHNTANEF